MPYPTYSLTWTAPDLISNQNRIVVTSTDIWGLSATDTSNVFEIYDAVNPTIIGIEPIGGIIVPEHEPLTVKWQTSDNIGIDSVKVYYSNNNGVMARPIWRLMNNLEMYNECLKGDISNSIWLEDRVVNIPSSARI